MLGVHFHGGLMRSGECGFPFLRIVVKNYVSSCATIDGHMLCEKTEALAPRNVQLKLGGWGERARAQRGGDGRVARIMRRI